MRVLQELRAILRGGTARLKPLELAIIDALAEKIGNDKAVRLRQRIGEINLVQRHDGGREVNCYQIEGLKPVFKEHSRVLPTKGECVFARFSTAANDGTPLSGEIGFVNGHFFSLEFDQPTEHFLDDAPSFVEISLPAADN